MDKAIELGASKRQKRIMQACVVFIGVGIAGLTFTMLQDNQKELDCSFYDSYDSDLNNSLWKAFGSSDRVGTGDMYMYLDLYRNHNKTEAVCYVERLSKERFVEKINKTDIVINETGNAIHSRLYGEK